MQLRKIKDVNKNKENIFILFLVLTRINLAPTYFCSQWKIKVYVVLVWNCLIWCWYF